MTMASTQSPVPARRKEFPAWVSLALILLAVAAAVTLLWWYWSASNPTRRIVLSPDSPQARALAEERDRRRAGGGGGGPNRPREVPVGVRPEGNEGAFTARGGEVRLRIAKNREGQWNYRFDYLRNDLITPEQTEYFTGRWRISRDAAVATGVGATPEQVDKLKALPGMGGMRIDDADRQKIIALWTAYESATDKPAAEQAIVAALDEIGKKNLDATKQQFTDRANAIKAVLSAEQWAKLKAMAQ